jgi:hypothetical protein
MIPRRVLVVLAATAAAGLSLALAAGCESQAAPPPPVAVSRSTTTSGAARHKAFDAATAQLSRDVHAPKDSIAGVSQEEVTWPDGCLGCPKTGEMCVQVLTPGYRVVLRVGDANYEYHTDLVGTARLCSQSGPGDPPPPSPPAAAPTPYR